MFPQAKAVTIGGLGFTGPTAVGTMEPFSPFQAVYLQSTYMFVLCTIHTQLHFNIIVCQPSVETKPTGSLPVTYSFKTYSYIQFHLQRQPQIQTLLHIYTQQL